MIPYTNLMSKESVWLILATILHRNELKEVHVDTHGVGLLLSLPHMGEDT